jgi:hypothetical protein
MEDRQNGKTAIVTSKTFLAVGPTLHYSHEYVHAFWAAAVITFAATCLFWSKILTGSLVSFGPQHLTSLEHWWLGRFLVSGTSIFEYPWQILVLALLMGILAIAPVLTAQLLSFAYCLPFIAAVLFLANLPGFAACLLVSCIAVACRPLRFRSRFIAVALCTLPQLLYWSCFGGLRGVEPVKWGFSVTPWISAWLICLGVAGVVIGIGHFTRYRPGLIWSSTLLVFLIAVAVFDTKVGFGELDYQLYIARNNPEKISEFQDHSITEALNKTVASPAVIRYLGDFFYPTDPNLRRAELKREIQDKLTQDRWPGWFITPPELNFQDKNRSLIEQYDSFINRRPKSRRMPIALYYKALLSEYSPDLSILGQKETLHFYSDYPFERSRSTWYRLYSEFGNSPESLEARWRIAMHWAGQQRFEQADALAADALACLDERLKSLSTAKEQNTGDTLFSPFQPPADSVMTASKLMDLQRWLNQLRALIGAENRTNDAESAKRLAKFIMLDPHSRDYPDQLAQLLEQLGKNDPLRDNALLAQAKLIADEQLRAEKFSELHKRYRNTDAGMQALYELALLKIQLWRRQDQANAEQKKLYLADAKATLTGFLSLYPKSICAEQAKKNLADLPAAE